MRTLYLTGLTLLLTACAAPAPAMITTAPAAWPEGVAYRAASISEHGRDRPLVPGTRLRIRFDRPGFVVLEAGCNMIGVSSQLTDGRMTEVGFTATAMGCAPERLAQDAWLVDFFGAGPAVVITADAVAFSTADAEIRLILD
jgi:heat shock protein HslJ